MAPRAKTPLAGVKPEAYPLLSREAIGALKWMWRRACGRDGVITADSSGGALRSFADEEWQPSTYLADYSMRLVALLAQELPAWREVTGLIAERLLGGFPEPRPWSVQEDGRSAVNRPVNAMSMAYFAHSLMLATVITGGSMESQGVETWEAVIAALNGADHDLPAMNGSPCGRRCGFAQAFPSCILVAGLSAHLHDVLYGTNYGRRYRTWLTWLGANGSQEVEPPENPFAWCTRDVDVRIGKALSEAAERVGPGFVFPALQVAPVDPVLAFRFYDDMCRAYGVEDDVGWHLELADRQDGGALIGHSVANGGTFAAAHELNDSERLQGLRCWFDACYHPTFVDGEFSYRFSRSGEGAWSSELANVLAMMAHVGDPGAMRRLYNEPGTQTFRQPTVEAIDYPNMVVRQAYFDIEKDALILGTTPGGGQRGARTTFRVTNLGPEAGREVLMDSGPWESWIEIGPGHVLVETTIDDHTFVIR